MHRTVFRSRVRLLSIVAVTALVVSFTSACSRTAPVVEESSQQVESGQTFSLSLLQLNDVYEITPVEGGKAGGLARVATIRKDLLADDPNTLTLLAGDFLSPSALGTAKVDGVRLAGKHMVEVLNAVGVDLVTLGNHEFDLSREQLIERIAESDFVYVAGNVLDEKGGRIPGVVPYRILRIPAGRGRVFRLGVLGVTADIVPVDYVAYAGYKETVKSQVAMLRDSVDAFVAMTHLFLAQDIDLATEVPELALIMGGHDHENVLVLRGPSMTPIAKADANARSVYVHTLTYDFSTGETSVDSRIVPVTDEIPDDPTTNAVIESWLDRAWEGFRASGFAPQQVVATVSDPLDGRESSVLHHPTRLTRLIAAGMRAAAGETDLSIYNAGMIRIDDVIPPGRVTQYDIIRVLPFGGNVLTVDMKGSLLDSVLTQGAKNEGSGGFLQADGVREEGGIWFLNEGAILPDEVYRVAINDFLVSGREANLEFLTLDSPNAKQVDRHGDIRFAVIDEMKRQYPPKP
ncbi:MAG: bifunctional metallophosphatase/5'-nucleotidase [Rhodothermales bacterium]